MPQSDAIIIGGGLAGLNCARELTKAGVPFMMFDASDAVGGRVRTDAADGFLFDRGFQVLLTAYPEVQEAIDLDDLDLGYFFSGALIWMNGRFTRVGDPLREMSSVASTLLSPIGTFSDKLRLAALRQSVTSGPFESVFSREEITTIDALRDRWGFSEEMIEHFFRPFLGGIFLENDLLTSSRMFEFVFRMFALGRAALPANGMGAIPAALASALPPDSIRLNTRVERAARGEVVPAGGETLLARAVVVATEAPAAAAILGRDVHPSGSRGTTCLYFAADEPPRKDPVLTLNGSAKGPVNNVTVLSNVSPSYAPPGTALISVTVLGRHKEDPATLLPAIRTQLAEWFGKAVRDWRLLRTYNIEYALPDQTPPFLTPVERPVRIEPGVYLCGDHRRTASINGAMTSGRRAAEAVVEDLKSGRI